VGVTAKLLSHDLRGAFGAEVAADQERQRAQHAERQASKTILSLEEARRRRLQLDWGAYVPPVPLRPEIQVFADYPLDELASFIDWTPFFRTWEMAGTFPRILDDGIVGAEARSLFADARALLRRIIDERLLTARGVVGLFPANAVGDDIALYASEDRTERLATIHTLRQQFEKAAGRPNLALADFVAPRDADIADYVGGFAVSTGFGLTELCAEFERDHDDYASIMAKALADRLAEAFAERVHQRVRVEFWGHAPKESLNNEALIAEQYTGIRPAPGYPACPEHSGKQTLFDLLDVAGRTGITLTESFAMLPTAAVSGWYFSHPEAFYFGVGKIGRDQVEDYATRRGIPLEEAERRLAPTLAYDPEPVSASP